MPQHISPMTLGNQPKGIYKPSAPRARRIIQELTAVLSIPMDLSVRHEPTARAKSQHDSVAKRTARGGKLWPYLKVFRNKVSPTYGGHDEHGMDSGQYCEYHNNKTIEGGTLSHRKYHGFTLNFNGM